MFGTKFVEYIIVNIHLDEKTRGANFFSKNSKDLRSLHAIAQDILVNFLHSLRLGGKYFELY